MQINAVQIIIERDPMTKIPKTVPVWELAIYQEKYPDQVQVVDEALVAEIDDLPDEREEFARLQNVFGVDSEANVPVIGLVYGRGNVGAKALGEAMQAGVVGASKATSAAKKAAKSADTDPLADPK